MIKARYNHGIFTPLSSTAEFKEGVEYFLEVVKDKRSLQQNKYIHKVFNIISEETGYTPNEVKTLMLIDIGHSEIIKSKKNDKSYEVPKETRNLTKKDFSELTELILKWCSEKGFNVLTPEEYFLT